MSNVIDVFWCEARDEQGSLLHTPDCDQRDCFEVQGKKQETNTGGKAKLPDHYRCTITCAFCGKRKLYEDDCYHTQRLSAKIKTENASGKGDVQGQWKRPRWQKLRWTRRRRPQAGEGQECEPVRREPHHYARENSEPSGGQPNRGPTSRSQTQAQ